MASCAMLTAIKDISDDCPIHRTAYWSGINLQQEVWNVSVKLVAGKQSRSLNRQLELQRVNKQWKSKTT